MTATSTHPAMQTRRVETRIYPPCCLSDNCGCFAEDCERCRNKPTLDEFKAWRAATGAVQIDPTWAPSFYVATTTAVRHISLPAGTKIIGKIELPMPTLGDQLSLQRVVNDNLERELAEVKAAGCETVQKHNSCRYEEIPEGCCMDCPFWQEL